MGQTQLLMLVMAVIIIGIAVAVGISQMGESAFTANQNGIVNDCASLVSKAQTWYRTPTMMGGGNNTYDDITLAVIGSDPQGTGTKVNENGSFAIGGAGQVVQCAGVGTEVNEAGEVPTVVIEYNAENVGSGTDPFTTTIDTGAEGANPTGLLTVGGTP